MKREWTCTLRPGHDGPCQPSPEIAKLRRAQAERVMPLIGPLLDAWDNTDNDTKATMCSEYPVLCDYLDKIEAAVNLD